MTQLCTPRGYLSHGLRFPLILWAISTILLHGATGSKIKRIPNVNCPVAAHTSCACPAGSGWDRLIPPAQGKRLYPEPPQLAAAGCAQLNAALGMEGCQIRVGDKLPTLRSVDIPEPMNLSAAVLTMRQAGVTEFPFLLRYNTSSAAWASLAKADAGALASAGVTVPQTSLSKHPVFVKQRSREAGQGNASAPQLQFDLYAEWQAELPASKMQPNVPIAKLMAGIEANTSTFKYATVALEDLGWPAADVSALVEQWAVRDPQAGFAHLMQGAAAQPSVARAWIGSAGVTAQTHRDIVHNVFLQVHGKKRVLLYPPEASVMLHAYPAVHPAAGQSAVPAGAMGIADKDAKPPGSNVRECPATCCAQWRWQFPLASSGFSRAGNHTAWPAMIDLEPGDALYIPPGWWHRIKASTASVSVSVVSPALVDSLAQQANWEAPPLNAAAEHIVSRQGVMGYMAYELLHATVPTLPALQDLLAGSWLTNALASEAPLLPAAQVSADLLVRDEIAALLVSRWLPYVTASAEGSRALGRLSVIAQQSDDWVSRWENSSVPSVHAVVASIPSKLWTCEQQEPLQCAPIPTLLHVTRPAAEAGLAEAVAAADVVDVLRAAMNGTVQRLHGMISRTALQDVLRAPGKRSAANPSNATFDSAAGLASDADTLRQFTGPDSLLRCALNATCGQELSQVLAEQRRAAGLHTAARRPLLSGGAQRELLWDLLERYARWAVGGETCNVPAFLRDCILAQHTATAPVPRASNVLFALPSLYASWDEVEEEKAQNDVIDMGELEL